MASTDGSALYEAAQKAIGVRMSSLSAKIYAEHAKAESESDCIAVAQWQARRTELAHEADRLVPEDSVGIARVLALPVLR